MEYLSEDRAQESLDRSHAGLTQEQLDDLGVAEKIGFGRSPSSVTSQAVDRVREQMH